MNYFIYIYVIFTKSFDFNKLQKLGFVFCRCSAMGLITSIGYLGIAVCPLIMKIEVLAHAVVPLGVMGCLSLTTGLLCHFLLPRTKGSTAETFEDGSDISRFMEWSPRVQRTQTKLGETEVERVEMIESCADEFSVRFQRNIFR